MRGALLLVAIGAILLMVVLGTLAGVRWAMNVASDRENREAPLDAATVTENLGSKVPLDLYFTDAEGRRDRLGNFMGALAAGDQGVNRPTLLVMAYFNCRTLCNLVLQGTRRSLSEVDKRAGEDYRVLTISIDPRDTPLDARAKREEIGAPEWTYLVGSEGEVREMAEAVGFGYHYDAATDQYSHPAVIFALTPEGAISSYIYGLDPEPIEVEGALEEAKVGGTRSTIQRILLRCYHYIPALRRYSGMVRWLLRAGGALTLLFFGALVWRLVGRAPSRGVA